MQAQVSNQSHTVKIILFKQNGSTTWRLLILKKTGKYIANTETMVVLVCKSYKGTVTDLELQEIATVMEQHKVYDLFEDVSRIITELQEALV